jgi:molybdopterin-guanine dinucleotide biosynthesis protein
MQEAFPHLKIIVVAGTSSNSGKTTLVCEMLRHLTADESWEAIKLSRGHYRSCGKDPQACCVSGLLGNEAVIRSGRAETYTCGKDTGRFWDAGASNVHWVIASDEQVESGIHGALARVSTRGVIIEGTSVLRYLEPALALLAVSNTEKHVKASARWALQANRLNGLYGNEAASKLNASLPRFNLARCLEAIANVV